MKRERNQQNIFFNLEKSNSVNNTIFSLKKEDGSYTTSDTEILQEQYIYYQKLYTEDNIPENDIYEYIEPQGVAKTLNNDERQSLEGRISEVECEEAIMLSSHQRRFDGALKRRAKRHQSVTKLD